MWCCDGFGGGVVMVLVVVLGTGKRACGRKGGSGFQEGVISLDTYVASV